MEERGIHHSSAIAGSAQPVLLLHSSTQNNSGSLHTSFELHGCEKCMTPVRWQGWTRSNFGVKVVVGSHA